jgi:cytochrome c551/c552
MKSTIMSCVLAGLACAVWVTSAGAQRGPDLLEAKGCLNCHLSDDIGGVGPSLGNQLVPDYTATALAATLWNHTPAMWSAMGGPHALSEDEWAIVLRQLYDLRFIDRSVRRRTEGADTAEIDARFLTARHCGSCHGGSASFAASLSHNKTVGDVREAVVGHATLPAVTLDELDAIVGYVWELQYQGRTGTAGRGELVFTEKGCASCHRSPARLIAQSPRPGRAFTPYSMIALSWEHGPAMQRLMLDKGLRWPELTADDMADLVAYLNTLTR